MPTYVYECSQCKDVYEVDQRITEDALKDCRCGSIGTLKRVIQPVGVMFKGSGFHINDYSGSAAKSESNSVETSSVAEPKAEPSPTPTPVKETVSEAPAISAPAKNPA